MTISNASAGMPEWTVGDRLRKARELVDLDRKAFAVELGLSRNTVAKYEGGDEKPRPVLLMAWAMRTGVTVEWLTTGHWGHSQPAEPKIRLELGELTLIRGEGTINEPWPRKLATV